MAIRLIQIISGTPDTLKKWDDADIFDAVTLQAEIDEDQAKLDLPVNIFDEMFSELDGTSENYDNPDAYRAKLQDNIDKRKELIDYYSYTTEVVNLSVAKYKWISPDSVESVCGEDSGEEASKMIDGDNGTWWEHSVDEQHEIILKLQDWTKRFDQIRFRMGNGLKQQLNDVSVYIANNSGGGLNASDNLVISGVNVPSGSGWHTETFTTKGDGKFAKIVIPSTQHASNYARIVEVEFRAGTMTVDL